MNANLDPNQSVTWPFVAEFALRMEAKLQKNMHKGGPTHWMKLDVHTLLQLLDKERLELQQAISYADANKAEIIANEAADLGNFAMMIASWYSPAGFSMRREGAILVRETVD